MTDGPAGPADGRLAVIGFLPPGRDPRAGPGLPELPPTHLRRPRLERCLADDRRRRVTLVSAGPGSGKTELLTSWARHSPTPVAWVTATTAHNADSALADAVLAAMGSPLIGAPPGDTEPLDRAFHELQGTSCRTVLAIDRAEVLRSPSARATLDHLVRHAPSFLDVVVAGRTDEQLPIARLTLERRLGELHGAVLAFTAAETKQLLLRRGVELASHELAAIQRETGGRAAAVAAAAARELRRSVSPG
jgi:LuxR family transcriptional regulator, maltose regulon positive regulatory protein